MGENEIDDVLSGLINLADEMLANLRRERDKPFSGAVYSPVTAVLYIRDHIVAERDRIMAAIKAQGDERG